MVAEGDEKTLTAFLLAMQSGPLGGNIQNVKPNGLKQAAIFQVL